MKEKENKGRKIYRRMIVNCLIMLAGLIFVIVFVQHMQQRYSELKSEKTSKNAIASIIQTLDENTEKVDLLIERYHKDNQIIVNDFATMFQVGRYKNLQNYSVEARCEVMRSLPVYIRSDGYLFMTDKKGTIILAPEEKYLDTNIIENGTFTQEDFQKILTMFDQRSENADEIEPFYVVATPADTNEKTYFYGKPITEDYCILYGIPVSDLESQYAALKEMGSILSNTVVGKSGFVFSVNAEDGKFLYFNDGKEELTGCSASEYGITEEALADNYSGVQVINGKTYYCYSKTYQSNLYDRNIVISAVCSTKEIYANNQATIIITVIAFVLGAAICLFYSIVLQMDPGHLVYYDEEVFDSKNKKKNVLFHSLSANNVKLGKFRGEQVYFKAGIARSLIPVIVITLLIIFAVSWNAQTLVEITKGLSESESTLKQTERLFDNSESSSKILMDRYQHQYLTKLQIISFMLEEDPNLVFNHSDSWVGKNAQHYYVDEEYNRIKDSDGNGIISLSESSDLQSLAEKNGIESLYVIDDKGRTIATNTDSWYFTISDDPESQSHEFSRVINGELEYLIQEPRDDEMGNKMQYVGTYFWYYTLSGQGKKSGTYVPEEIYENSKKDGYYKIDGVKYKVVAHRGMIEGGIKDETINAIMESTKPEYLLHQIKVDTNGFMILFDNTDDHACLWSPYESSIGLPAKKMNVPDKAFSGTYKGFTTVNGVKYFQDYFFENGYWIATTIPLSDLFAGRGPIALITLLLSSAFFFLLYIFSVFVIEREERNIVSFVEKRIIDEEDNGMVKITMKDGRSKYVRSAAARYSSTNVSWGRLLPAQKLNVVLQIVLGVIVIIAMICTLLCERIFGSDSVITYIIQGDWDHSFNYFAYVAFAATVICVFAVTSIISMVIRFLIKNMGTRVETIGQLLLSVLKYGSVLFSIFYGLSLLGVSTAGLVTSASIMSIVIGLGSQSLISDILAGIFIVFEGAFRVGDIVSLDGFEGLVVDIGLRTTKIEDIHGNIKIYNNAKINSILNMTKKATSVKIRLTIGYNENLEMAEDLLHRTCEGMKSKYPQLLSDPKYIGVSELSEDGIVLTIMAVCAEQDRGNIRKSLTRDFYLMLRDNNVICPYQKK